MLKLQAANFSYDKLNALCGITMEVLRGQCTAVIGSNGAGKTTLLRVISGVLRFQSGEITFKGKPIHQMTPDEICREGIIQVPEGRKLFPRMTVIENLEMGAYLSKARKCFKESLTRVYEYFPILEERKDQLAGTLSGGQQQVLAVARSLMALPCLLMLDEPSLGLAPKVAKEIFMTLKRLNQEGLTLLLVTQEVQQALTLADRAYVLENSRIVMEGTGRELLESPKVKEAYLGF
jgi:branched-chain amino acid transport system ATP-binding protein